MEVKIQEYYHNQQTISTRDVHLFTQPLQDLLRARLGTKRRICKRQPSYLRIQLGWQKVVNNIWTSFTTQIHENQGTIVHTPKWGNSLPLDLKQSSQLSLLAEPRLKNGIKENYMAPNEIPLLSLLRENVSTLFSLNTSTKRHHTCWDDQRRLSFTYENPGLACQEALCWLPYQS